MFVRWLGAFCHRAGDKAASAAWEVSQAAREVAAEPLYRGRSLLLWENEAVFVGLVACEQSSIFRAGFFRDCRSRHDRDGLLTGKGRPVRDLHRFKAAWNKSGKRHHGEAFFDLFTARAVAVRAGSSAARLQIARDIARSLNLPIVSIEEEGWRAVGP